MIPLTICAVVLMLLIVTLSTKPAQSAPVLPADFSDIRIAQVNAPTALAFTPDNRLLITTQAGAIHVYTNGNLIAAAALDLSAKLCANGERGLLGIAVDPAFATNSYIYVYYTFNKFSDCGTNIPTIPVNRVSRFTLPANNVISPNSELVLLDNIPSPNSNHNGGDLHFGADGLLYVSVGDGGCSVLDSTKCAGQNDISRLLSYPLGKILRINKDGTIPTDNPRANVAGSRRCADPAGVPAGNGPCKEMFSWGLRNPFRFAFKPGSNEFFINDVGQNIWEEIDNGERDADYGWNVREGHCVNDSVTNCGTPPAGMTNPIYDYSHNTGCASITGGAFVPAGVWPTAYNGSYFFSDFVCGKIYQLQMSGTNTYTATEFISNLGGSSAVHMIFGAYNGTQAMYYTTYADGGEIHVIAYSGAANRSPTASFTANPRTSTTAPLTVNFNAAASSDPDNGDLISAYLWNFGDGRVVTTTLAIISNTYATLGAYTATLRVRDSRGGESMPISTQIFVGNTPPSVTIISPSTAKRFFVGERITLTATVSDREDGTIPAANMSWKVLLFHNFGTPNVHSHPFFGAVTGNNILMPPAPSPEDLPAVDNSFLQIQLTVTDSQGQSTVITQNILPKIVNLTFATNPAGGRIDVNGIGLTNTQTLHSWQGYALNISTANYTDAMSRTLTFESWSDGGAISHTVTTPARDTAYNANFLGTGCNVIMVTKTVDDNTCGTLRYAINNTQPGSLITVNLTDTDTTINLTDTLTITNQVTLRGDCGTDGPTITLNGSNAPSNSVGILLGGGAHLEGVVITGFGGSQFKAIAGGNYLQCVKVSP